MAAEYELTLSDYFSIFKRRARHLVGAFVLIFGTGVIIAIALPPVYQSTGTVLVESQQIPSNLVTANITGFADERIEIIRQRVMTRENLIKIVDKYRLFEDTTKSLTVSEKIDEMRTAIEVVVLSANVKNKGQTTIAFTLSFEHRDPGIANRVANELVTLFLDENVKQRTERATETTEFLAQEAAKLRVELDKVEGQLADYKQKHGDALPQHQELRLTMISRTEAEMKEVERDAKTAQEELRFLDLELAATKASQASLASQMAAPKPSPPPPVLSPAALELGKLRAEYSRVRAIYKEEHPDVRAVKRKIEVLEAAGVTDAPPEPEKPATPVTPAAPMVVDVAKVQTKIAATHARIQSLDAQAKSLRAKLGSYERQVIQSPQVERGLVTLMRDYESAQKKYEEIRSKEMTAKISENLEQENKAERFVLLEPPLVPDKPIKPNRKKIATTGFFLALAGALGLVMLLESIHQRVRGPGALATVLGQRVLASIPYIPTQTEYQARAHGNKRLVALAIAAGIALLVALHFLYMPLDILTMKILARIE